MLARFPFRSAVLFLSSIVLLAGCAGAPKYPPGQAMLKGEAPVFPPPPDSLRAELELTAFERGRKTSVSAVLSAKPFGRYKLDLFGLPGMVEGAMLWTPERWTLVIFGREAFMEGAGESVEIGNLGLRDVSVHDAFSFLWGGLPGLGKGTPRGGGPPGNGVMRPGGDGRPGDGVDSTTTTTTGSPEDWTALGDGAFAYTGRGRAWRVFLDGETGRVRGAMRTDSSFRIEYGEYRAGPESRDGTGKARGRPLANKARLFSRAGPLLEIRVKNVEADPVWRRDPFTLKVPAGFKRLERAPVEGPGE